MSAEAIDFSSVKEVSASALLEAVRGGSVTRDEGLLMLGRLSDAEYATNRADLCAAFRWKPLKTFDKERETRRRQFLSAEARARVESSGKIWIDLGAPRETAQQFLRQAPAALRSLKYYQRQWHGWNGRHYAAVEEPVVYALLDRWMAANDCDPDTKGKSDVRSALRDLTQVIGTVEYGSWLDGRGGEWIALDNVLLNLGNGHTVPHSPEFLNLFALPFAYDPKAKCDKWLEFLREVYEGDEESVEALQRVFGWTLTRALLEQAIVLLLGEKRSGKGTIGRVLAAMLGPDAVVGVDLHTLGAHFGLEKLIGKRVGIASESRVGSGKHSNYVAAVERMLAISGQDLVSAPRKGIGDWNGILEARFVMMANDAPWLHDTTDALLSRLIVIPHRVSFAGREDRELTDKLKAELSGIFLWALEGLRLVRLGGLLRPERSSEEMTELEEQFNPLARFVEEELVIESGAVVSKLDVRMRLEQWWKDQGLTMAPPPMNKLTTGLRRIVGRAQFKAGRRRLKDFHGKALQGSGRPTTTYEGVRLVRHWEEDR